MSCDLVSSIGSRSDCLVLFFESIGFNLGRFRRYHSSRNCRSLFGTMWAASSERERGGKLFLHKHGLQLFLIRCSPARLEEKEITLEGGSYALGGKGVKIKVVVAVVAVVEVVVVVVVVVVLQSV